MLSPLVLLVKVRWKQRTALGSEEGIREVDSGSMEQRREVEHPSRAVTVAVPLSTLLRDVREQQDNKPSQKKKKKL